MITQDPFKIKVVEQLSELLILMAGRPELARPSPSEHPTAPRPPLRQILEVRPDPLPSNKEQIMSWRQFQTPRSVTWSGWLRPALDFVFAPFQEDCDLGQGEILTT